MLEFEAREFFGVLNRLISIRRDLEKRADQTLTTEEQSHMHTYLDRAESVCATYDIDVSYYTDRARQKIDDPTRFTFTLAEAVNGVRHSIMEKLRDRKFMYIPTADAQYLNYEDLFGDEVHGSFPEAHEDIGAAGHSIACGLNTASVFHSMRVAEFGLRRIGARLRVRLKDKGHYQPIEYGTWDKVITACKNKIDAIRKKPIGPKRQEQLEFYSDAADHCVL